MRRGAGAGGGEGGAAAGAAFGAGSQRRSVASSALRSIGFVT